MTRITKSDVVTWVNSYIESLIAFENRPDHPLAALMETHGGSGGGMSGSRPPINDAMSARDRRVHRALREVKEINGDWAAALEYYAVMGSLGRVSEHMNWSKSYARASFDAGYACFRGVWSLI